MKNRHFIFLPIFGMSLISPAAFSQEDELDFTIRVMEENEQPADFVQRIELPSPSSFDISPHYETAVSQTLDEDIENTDDDIAETVNESETASMNTIIEKMSIDCAEAQPDTDNLGNLTDVTDDLANIADGVGNNSDDTTNDIVEAVDDACDNFN